MTKDGTFVQSFVNKYEHLLDPGARDTLRVVEGQGPSILVCISDKSLEIYTWRLHQQSGEPLDDSMRNEIVAFLRRFGRS